MSTKEISVEIVDGEIMDLASRILTLSKEMQIDNYKLFIMLGSIVHQMKQDLDIEKFSLIDVGDFKYQ